MSDIWPVILSGGVGNRLWPLSRKRYPKQFQALTGGSSLFQETARRVAPEFGFPPPVVVCNEEHRFIAAEQLRLIDIEPQTLLLEPVSRNTAPAIAAAAGWLRRRDPDAVMAVFHSDHAIPDGAALRAALAEGAELAAGGRMVTLCVDPDRPHTGYGYIHCGAPLNAAGTAYRIEAFVEKPDEARARELLDGGDHRWNAGIFLFNARALLRELARFEPEIVARTGEALAKARSDLGFLRLEPEEFTACPTISIDHALMERTGEGAAVRLDGSWHDVGSWEALWRAGDRDERGNVSVGDVTLSDVADSYIRADAGLVAAVRVDGLVVVATEDVVFVGRKDDPEAPRAAVELLEGAAREEVVVHTRDYRPWGYFDRLGKDAGFQVKHLRLSPGARLSLQRHKHRAEHWVVVSGRARVTCGDVVTILEENESTFIPLGAVHRLEAVGDTPLSLVEVQTGDELREDDIERFEDVYQRI